MMVRTASQAKQDLLRCMRSGEEILASCTGGPVEPPLFDFGGVDTAFYFVTNARFAQMSANNDGMNAVRWKYVTKMDFGRKRFKPTLSYSFTKPSFNGTVIDYDADYVSKEVVAAARSLFNVPSQHLEIPDEWVTALKVSAPHDNSNIGQVAQIMGLTEFRLECSKCGMSAGHCSTSDGDLLSDECEGCLRRFDGIELR